MSGAPRSTYCPSRKKISVTRPCTSGRSSIEFTASIRPVALTASVTRPVRAVSTSTGIGGIPPGGPPAAACASSPPPQPASTNDPIRRAPARAGRTLRICSVNISVITIGCGYSVPGIEETAAQQRFDPRHREPDRVAGLHQGGVGIAEFHLGLEEVEDRGGTFAIARR